MNIHFISSPAKHFTDTVIQPTFIILHCIGYPTEKALDLLTGNVPDVEASAHYFVPQLNLTTTSSLHNVPLLYPVYQLVDDTKKAWHAGVSQWQETSSLNACSIGIEFSCPNYANALSNPDNLNFDHFESFSSDQIRAGILLIKELMERYHIHPANVLTHADISGWRVPPKTDPGALFPMELLARNGIGVWPAFQRTRETAIDTSIANCQHLLKKVGYHIDLSGELTIQTLSVIKSFKIHYMPEAYGNDVVDTIIDEKMITGLENLIDNHYRYPITFQEPSCQNVLS